ncbi:EamA family transporter RarD [Paraliomyxa miuraensis]|uniref:EamA family transporter RarD n=1 Tax=Paraliomyxa miuraensis TaxID=376150 RepID=UPI002252A261|nr:EamA family transporter RarD [Paraliomyxa miuraensis]MCX4241764.1 EamA family transporter RarD [Paraliomyxa miuraensis]
MSVRTPDRSTPDATAAGLGYALLAYGAWGLFPLFWKQVAEIPALELVAHRVTWACVAYLVLVLVRRRGRELVAGLRDRATLRTIVPAGLLVGINWLTFIYAVATDRVLHASLGYFLNPLVSIVLGMVFLGERMRRAQWVAVALAGVGVAFMASLAEGLPWIGLVLGLTFGAYGLMRKIAPVDGLLGATIESVLLVPAAVLYLVILALDGTGAMGRMGTGTDLLLLTAGVITAAPLVWFANAARRLPLRTLGFMQYMAPTGQFALAVLVFGEPLTSVHLRGFGCIWAGVLLFTVESWWASRRRTA